jgi:DNA-binding XRE family transcriptional regulator
MMRAMTRLTFDDVARRLRAVRDELHLTPPAMAEAIHAGRAAYYTWEKGSAAAKPNLPNEQAMVNLCELLPGLTMDYLYRGRYDTLDTRLRIRLMAREMGMDPDAAGFDRRAATMALAEAMAAQSG